MQQWLERVLSPSWLVDLSGRGFRIVAIVAVAWILVRVARSATPRVVRRVGRGMGTRPEESDAELLKRSETLSSILVSLLIVTAWSIAILMALRELGFDIGPVLAGAGVVGLAVGFGAQNLVRDVIAGGFMLLENQVRVGDVAVINGTGGLVERMNLRTITLRSQDGAVHVFANGAITSLSNLTHEYAFYVFDVGVAYKEDTDRVTRVLEEVASELRETPTFGADILEPLEVLGVDAFEDSAVVIKARIKTKPIRQWAVGREMNRRIKKRFDEVGIEIPFPHRTLVLASPVPATASAKTNGRSGADPRASSAEA